MWKLIQISCVCLIVPAALAAEADGSAPAPNADPILEERADAATSWRDLSRWSFQGGVAFITKSAVDDVGSFRGERAEDEAEGEIYLMQVSYKAAQWTPSVFGRPMELDAELPLVFGVVNEHVRQPFVQTSGGFALRWKNLPWNRWVYTNLETGIGLTYSQRVLAAERQRHPDRERSHLEIYWPVQVMLAHPRRKDHQLVLFLHHHSGGTIFHEGGANSLGVGYRYVPGERTRSTTR